MYICRICGFSVPLDDTIVAAARGGCFCLRCYLRLIDDRPVVTTKLHRQAAAVAGAA